MLLSMTGHGQGVADDDLVHVLAEIRSVNNRYLKTTINSDLDSARESQLEGMIRDKVQRGSVNLRLKLMFHAGEQDYQINLKAVQKYREQLESLGSAPQLDSLLQLPGVVQENINQDRIEPVWHTIESAVELSLGRLLEMRLQEGQAMHEDLLANCERIDELAQKITELSPNVTANYAKRITDRINQLLVDHDVQVEPSDVIREVGVFAEKVDISEELVRLQSHLKQFRTILDSDQSNGRKLDFLTQELLRETNTIGSKANDAEIAAHVVEIKTIIERIREMVQNVE